MTTNNANLFSECKKRLLLMKQDILNRLRSTHAELFSFDKATGDEVDQSVAIIAENHLLANQDRLHTQLLEIEFALARIERGNFGICEETLEPIEIDRLLAIPYTRLSIEGAEIREASLRKFAR